jgi:cardiolipin synthase
MPRSRWLDDLWQLLRTSELATVLGFLLALVLLAHLLNSKRPRSSTIAWLVTIVLVPYLGVPLYLMFGGRKIKRMAGRKEMVYARSDGSDEGGFGGGTERLLRSFGVPPATVGNRVTLVTSGEEAYRQLVRIIDEAERSIHITTYILGRDAVGYEIVALLTRRAAEGLEVRLLLDDVGSWRVKRRFLNPLIEAGGKVAFFMPVIHRPFQGRANLRNHRKLAVADGRVALTGGMNVAQEYMGPLADPTRWRDVSMVVEGPVAGDLDALFQSDWSFATGDSQDGSAATEKDSTPTVESRAGDSHGPDTAVQVVASGPDVEGDPLYESLVALLFAARERIWVVTPYFVPDEILARALDIAARRGVDVRLVVPYRSNHVSADLARVGFLRQIHDAGGTILRYKPVMMHAKVIIVDDDLAIVGSANMDMRSLFFNYEVALYLYSAGQVHEAEAWVRTLLPDCHPGLAPQKWAIGLAESVVRLLAPLL